MKSVLLYQIYSFIPIRKEIPIPVWASTDTHRLSFVEEECDLDMVIHVQSLICQPGSLKGEIMDQIAGTVLGTKQQYLSSLYSQSRDWIDCH